MFDDQNQPATKTIAPAVVFLARHAETVSNVERRFQGHGDSPLSERGVEQARRLGRRLASEPLAAVYSSDLGRARQTAEHVAAPHGLEVRTHVGLREIDVGELTGRSRAQAGEVPEWARVIELYGTRPSAVRMPGGETIAEVQTRALAALREIAALHLGRSIALISHHVVVETIVAHALGAGLEQLWLPHRGGNCFLSVLEVTPDACLPRVIYDGRHIGELAGLDGTKGERKATA